MMKRKIEPKEGKTSIRLVQDDDPYTGEEPPTNSLPQLTTKTQMMNCVSPN